MPRIDVESLDDPRVAMYRHLKSSNLLRDGRLFIAEGIRVVERLLESDYQVDSVLVAERRADEWTTRVPPKVPLYVVPQDVGEQLTGFNFHVGVLACGIRRPSSPLEASLPQPGQPGVLVVCPNCDNPENLGAIVRIASAFGVRGLLLGRQCSDPFSRRVLRVSMGTAFRFPIRESLDLKRDLLRLKCEEQFEVVATVLAPAAVPLRQFVPPPRVALLLGNESEGLQSEWLDLSDHLVTIPMHGGVDSLNVAIAAGIVLHHVTPPPMTCCQ